MKAKKWLKMLTAVLLTVTLTAACAAAGGGGSGVIPKNLTELVIYTQLANFSGAQIGWAAEVLKEKFNVKITIINEMDGTFITRMESGNLGDIVIFGTDGNQYMDAKGAGMLYDWEEDDLLKTYGPYIAENMTLALEKNRQLSGGKLYGFGHNVAASADNHEDYFYYPYIRWDLYQALGYPGVRTLEDFVPVLEEMQKLEPASDTGTKTYGVSFFPDWDGDMVMMVKSTGALYGYDEFGCGLYDTKTQTFEDCLQEGGMYLRALKFYNTLYQKGLLDPDSMTQTFNDMTEKYLNGAAFFNIFSWMADPYNTVEHKEAGKVMACVAAQDQKNIVYGLNAFGSNRVWTIGAKTNYPELCMHIINWFCSPEGVLTYNYGPKGLLWDYDGDGNTFLTELGETCQRDKQTPVEYLEYRGTYKDGEFQHNNTTFSIDAVNPESALGETFNWRSWKNTLENEVVYPIEQSWRDYMGGVIRPDEYLEKNGHLSLSIGSSFAMATREGEFDTTWKQVAECIKAGSWSAIYAKTDAEYNDIVAKMINDAKAYGYGQCVEWTREQAALRKAAEDEAVGK
ncbi:MAG: extracellular solute-binding protein [Oscillospiraceae bacterium]|jgi:multiple sugar transport system substrate-binding protein/putative aldouronate transport system substrate-binding protein|nr:extracellular solute-binding protein [Oscillospiraceae bacterium]